MSGVDDAPRPPQARASVARRRRHQAASLPLDLMADIAARSDPVTLLRCAATCGDLRGRVADPGFQRRLRLRHADRFVPSLLRGHLIGDKSYSKGEPSKDELMYLVDAATVGVLRADECFPPGPDGEPLPLSSPISARDGLVLVHKAHELRVCNLATGRSQIIPPTGPEVIIGGHHFLLVGDGVGHQAGAVGRPFQVVAARLVLERKHRRVARLQVQTFSSELGAWGPCTELRTPQIHGKTDPRRPGDDINPLRPRPLVVGGAVHWLCFTDEAGFVLKLRVRATAAAPPRLAVTKLPETYPYKSSAKHLLATMVAGGSPAVLVADGEGISAWTWVQPKQQPLVVIRHEAISRLLGDRVELEEPARARLVWFAERSGIVLLAMNDYYLWLDLQSMDIVRWSNDKRINNKAMYYPCEMDVSTWAPTFSSSL